MRNLILAIVPVIALTALPALAQSSASESTTTTTTAVPAPVQSNETVTKKTYGNDGSTAQQSESQRSVTVIERPWSDRRREEPAACRDQRLRRVALGKQFGNGQNRPELIGSKIRKPPTTLKIVGLVSPPVTNQIGVLTKIGRMGAY